MGHYGAIQGKLLGEMQMKLPIKKLSSGLNTPDNGRYQFVMGSNVRIIESLVYTILTVFMFIDWIWAMKLLLKKEISSIMF